MARLVKHCALTWSPGSKTFVREGMTTSSGRCPTLIPVKAKLMVNHPHTNLLLCNILHTFSLNSSPHPPPHVVVTCPRDSGSGARTRCLPPHVPIPASPQKDTKHPRTTKSKDKAGKTCANAFENRGGEREYKNSAGEKKHRNTG